MELVAVVEMVPGQFEIGKRYEDAVLALLNRHDGELMWRRYAIDGATEVQLIRFGSRAGYESFLADPDRAALRTEVGDAAPTTRVIEVAA
ncbi:MAG TPA: hypothetical protein VGJ28_17130 [Micromonosporaceae bacterium]